MREPGGYRTRERQERCGVQKAYEEASAAERQGWRQEAFEEALASRWLGRVCRRFEETDSTNLRAAQLAGEGAPCGTLVLAEHQRAGRGRRGRSWDSQRGAGIFMSIVLRPDIPPERAPMTTLVTACSIACVLRERCGLDVKIKWPNDLVLNSRKVAGILTELHADAKGVRDIVVGVGINVNTEAFPEELADKAASLFLEAGHPFEREKLLAEVLNRLEEDYERFFREQDVGFLAAEYERLLVHRDEEVRILGAGPERCGTARGINARGELVIERPDGTREAVCAGEVSVRGLYHYV